MSEILGELTENVAVNLRSSLGSVDGQMSCLCHQERRGRDQKNQADANDKSYISGKLHHDSPRERREPAAAEPRSPDESPLRGPSIRVNVLWKSDYTETAGQRARDKSMYLMKNWTIHRLLKSRSMALSVKLRGNRERNLFELENDFPLYSRFLSFLG
jgi:hypothetical protein